MSTFDASRQQSIRSSATEHGILLASGEELEADLVVTPVAPDGAADWEAVPLIDLRSGYVLRSIDRLPRQPGGAVATVTELPPRRAAGNGDPCTTTASGSGG